MSIATLYLEENISPEIIELIYAAGRAGGKNLSFYDLGSLIHSGGRGSGLKSWSTMILKLKDYKPMKSKSKQSRYVRVYV